MKYIKLEKYIVSLDCVHGVLHSYASEKEIKNGCMPFYQVVISYNGGLTASLDFKNMEESQKSFDKIGEALGAH